MRGLNRSIILWRGGSFYFRTELDGYEDYAEPDTLLKSS